MNVAAFNLNHVRALHFLIEEAHVARAAARLGITPAAASNALARLRDDFDDPLLVRAGRKLARTALAEQLREPARDALIAIYRLFDGATFAADHYEGELVLTTSDRVAEALLPALDTMLSERAPHAVLSLRTVTVDVPAFLTNVGGVAIAPEETRGQAPGLRADRLFCDDFVCVLRKQHPLLKRRWTKQRFAAAEHVLVAPLGRTSRSALDDSLEAEGLSRRVTRIVSSFALAVPIVRNSDRVAVLPRSFAVARARAEELVLRDVPVALAPIPMEMSWHAAHEREPAHIWFRQLLRDVVKSAAFGSLRARGK